MIKNFVTVAFCLIFFGSINASILSRNWNTPINEAIKRLENGRWIQNQFSETDFYETTETLWHQALPIIKRAKKAKLLENSLDPNDETVELVEKARKKFHRKNSKIENIYLTDPGTLILKLKHFPKVLLKIDNRKEETLHEEIRSYSDAFESAHAVNESSAFPYLFFPKERMIYSSSLKMPVIFSEFVEFFSTSELDNRILLNILLTKAQSSRKLKKQLKNMYKNMVRYICEVDFDDINYRNLPFNKDGRLVPFDTNAGEAITGVGYFLKLFFASEIFSQDELGSIINTECSFNSKNISVAALKQLGDHEKSHQIFTQDSQIITLMKQYFIDKNQSKVILSGDFNQEEQVLLEYVESFVNNQIETSEGKTLIFGARCLDIHDLYNELLAFAKKAFTNAPRIKLAKNIWNFLEKLVQNKQVFTPHQQMSIQILNSKFLDSFVCF